MLTWILDHDSVVKYDAVINIHQILSSLNLRQLLHLCFKMIERSLAKECGSHPSKKKMRSSDLPL